MKKISFVLLSWAALVAALPHPLEWFLSSPKQELFSAKSLLYNAVDTVYSHGTSDFSQSENRTIFEVINSDPKFSRLAKAINFSEDAIPLLNDTSSKITFLATPNKALRAPGRHRSITENYQPHDLSNVINSLDYFNQEPYIDRHDKEKRRKLLKKLVTTILLYHVLPGEISAGKLVEISTCPTNLSFHHVLGGEPQRIRIQSTILPPSVGLNFYSNVIVPNIPASNGFIHEISHPLFPPLPEFSQAFLFPKYFSHFTSAFQRAGLTDELDLRWVSEDGMGAPLVEVKGTPTVTALLPSNRAFNALPKKLQLFLFSPFGSRALKKLLQFHVLPGIVLHSDYIYNSSSKETVNLLTSDAQVPTFSSLGSDQDLDIFSESQDANVFLEFTETRDFGAEVISSSYIDVPTLLPNHTMHIHIVKYNVTLPIPGPHKPHRVVTKMWANERRIAIIDVVNTNGASHILGKLVDPRKRKRGEKYDDNWDDWEEWLPRWADDN